MSIEKQIVTQRKVEQYIRGKLSDKEVDMLWERFLSVPEWFNYFETELHLRVMGKENLNPDA